MTTREDIIKIIYDKDFKTEPTFADLKELGISRKKVRKFFTNKTNLIDVIQKTYNFEYGVIPVDDTKETYTEKKKSLDEERKKFIEEIYFDFLIKKGRFPTYSDLLEFEISASTISTLFGGIEKLKSHVINTNKEEIKKYYSTLDDIFSGDRKNVESASLYPKRYIITTAVGDCEADKNFMQSIDTYVETNPNTQIIIMPCEMITNSFENKSALFDPIFNDEKYIFVSRDIELNKNIKLCSIQVSAKQIKSTTGLSRLGARTGSYIFAGPKQFLDYKPSGHNRGVNYAIMTTGACTKNNYFDNVYVSKRLSYIAEYDHTIGAIIVEVEDEEHFHFRQIQADGDGNFIDLGVEYRNDGTVKYNIPMNIVFGDIHAASVDKKVLNIFFDQFSEFFIENVFLHDVFDGNSINHHITNIVDKAKRTLTLQNELEYTIDLINDIITNTNPDKKVYIVKSNHDEFLDRYLSEGRYVSDAANHYISLKIAPALFEEVDVLKKAFDVVAEFNVDLQLARPVVFLSLSDSIKIGGVELAAHGHLGLNGAKPSLNSFEEAYGNCVVGHNHTAAIQRGVFRVGTMSKLDQGYNKGPNSWTHTNCIVYNNGQRQLVNYVNGKFYM